MRKAFNNNDPRLLDTIGPDGEVWIAASIVAGRKFGYLFVADLSTDFYVIPSDLGFDDGLTYWVFEANTTSKVQSFSTSDPLLLKVLFYSFTSYFMQVIIFVNIYDCCRNVGCSISCCGLLFL